MWDLSGIWPGSLCLDPRILSEVPLLTIFINLFIINSSSFKNHEIVKMATPKSMLHRN